MNGPASTSVASPPLGLDVIAPALGMTEEQATGPDSTSQPLHQPAGGPDPNRFDWKEVWYPIHYVQDLDRTKPTSFTLLDQDLAIWWEPSTQNWRVMADQCPHRLARLSEGRITADGYLECPYHGWAFSGGGQCERIPQLNGNAQACQSPRSRLQSLPTTVRQGLLFVYPGQPEKAETTALPIIEAMEETPEQWICLNTFRDLPYDALTLLENVLDSSHLPYTHHRSVGNRANAAPVELEVVESGKHGFTGVWAEGPRRGKLGRQDTCFVAPNFMAHDLTSKQFGRTLTVVYATPIGKGKCRLFARFPFKFASPWPGRLMRLSPIWYSHMSQNAILEDDQIFLHFQERALAAAGGSPNVAQAFYLPTKADLFVLQLHQWLKRYEAEPFQGQMLPPPWTKPQLLDRYHSHTVHCASCRGALAQVKRLRTGLATGAAIAWTVTLLLLAVGHGGLSGLPVGFSLLALLALGGWAALGRLERRFYEGREIPPRNAPEGTKRGSVKD
ncbi:MAG: Rieske 2Fe-2S domain-containing protein [Thermosynechococcaceae cyanobacterium]